MVILTARAGGKGEAPPTPYRGGAGLAPSIHVVVEVVVLGRASGNVQYVVADRRIGKRAHHRHGIKHALVLTKHKASDVVLELGLFAAIGDFIGLARHSQGGLLDRQLAILILKVVVASLATRGGDGIFPSVRVRAI